MRRTLALLMLVAACGRPSAGPPPVQPPTAASLAGGCYRLLGADGAPVRGPFWSQLVRLDSVQSRRMGRAWMGDLRPEWHDVVSLAPASQPLAEDTVRFSSHWWVPGPDSLHLMRTTGFHGEDIALAPVPGGFAGEREFFSDVIIPNEPRRFQAVRLVREVCPAG
jgi:hypothetical protein